MWRKREAYIGLVRCIYGRGNYSKYVNYNWSDYTMRLDLCKTFEIRHWVYTNGTKRLEGLVDPVHWAVNKDEDTRKRTSAKATVTFESPQVSTVPVTVVEEAEEMEWDSEEEKWAQN